LPSWVERDLRAYRQIRLDRTILFDRVWSKPVALVAEEWGLSGPGLAKACKATAGPCAAPGLLGDLEVGQRMRRPRLPNMGPGEAEEIVIWGPG